MFWGNVFDGGTWSIPYWPKYILYITYYSIMLYAKLIHCHKISEIVEIYEFKKCCYMKCIFIFSISLCL